MFLSFESRTHGTHGAKPHQQAPSAWQVSFNPSQPDLPAHGKVVEFSVRLRILVSAIGLSSSAKWI
jgi:hypothetical protein